MTYKGLLVVCEDVQGRHMFFISKEDTHTVSALTRENKQTSQDLKRPSRHSTETSRKCFHLTRKIDIDVMINIIRP